MVRFTICYDISKNKKRTRLVKILEEFGQRVQFSVFEFKLTRAQHINLMKKLASKGYLSDPPKDSNDNVTIYYFDQDPKGKIKRFGKQPIIDRESLLYI